MFRGLVFFKGLSSDSSWFETYKTDQTFPDLGIPLPVCGIFPKWSFEALLRYSFLSFPLPCVKRNSVECEAMRNTGFWDFRFGSCYRGSFVGLWRTYSHGLNSAFSWASQMPVKISLFSSVLLFTQEKSCFLMVLECQDNDGWVDARTFDCKIKVKLSFE